MACPELGRRWHYIFAIEVLHMPGQLSEQQRAGLKDLIKKGKGQGT
jgi:hypothetical protein